VSKCKKYKKLYEQKVKELKISVKQTKLKLDKYTENVTASASSLEAEKVSKKRPLPLKKPQILPKENAKEPIPMQATVPTQSQVQSALKLPYPVLNDKRDHKTILNTLETKFNDLHKKKDMNKKSIEMQMQMLYSSDKRLTEKNQDKLDKLKQLDTSISLLIQRLVKQIDYLKL
jgi:hypothetical protein